jgi:2-dehydropantoate 2-reductase
MKPRIVMVGTGALGGWYAGLLAWAGHNVSCLARRDAAVLKRDGVILRDSNGDRRVHFTQVGELASDLGKFDIVIIATKTTANGEIPALVRTLAAPDATLVTLQNGMGNAEVLANVAGPDKVVAGLCFVCINRLAPGLIENSLAGHIRFAAANGPANPRVHAITALFKTAGVDARADDDLESILWRKLCWNIPFNGLAIAGGALTTDRILADPELAGRARRLMLEVHAAAAARGHPFSTQHLEHQFTLTAGMGPYAPSSLIDYQTGKPVEVDAIWSLPLERGEAAGVAMPELRRLRDDILQRLAHR